MKVKHKRAWGLLAVASLSILWMAWWIDDWRRDFTTNTAVTDPQASDPDLRPLVAEVPLERLAAALRQWTAAAPRWSLVAAEGDADTDVQRIHLIRQTRLLRFTDDIHVVLTHDRDSAQSTLTAHSQSRVGKGDLGQNPRNLKELIRGVRDALAREAS